MHRLEYIIRKKPFYLPLLPLMCLGGCAQQYFPSLSPHAPQSPTQPSEAHAYYKAVANTKVSGINNDTPQIDPELECRDDKTNISIQTKKAEFPSFDDFQTYTRTQSLLSDVENSFIDTYLSTREKYEAYLVSRSCTKDYNIPLHHLNMKITYTTAYPLIFFDHAKKTYSFQYISSLPTLFRTGNSFKDARLNSLIQLIIWGEAPSVHTSIMGTFTTSTQNTTIADKMKQVCAVLTHPGKGIRIRGGLNAGKTSDANGIGQFISSTMFSVIKSAGAKGAYDLELINPCGKTFAPYFKDGILIDQAGYEHAFNSLMQAGLPDSISDEDAYAIMQNFNYSPFAQAVILSLLAIEVINKGGDTSVMNTVLFNTKLSDTEAIQRTITQSGLQHVWTSMQGGIEQTVSAQRTRTVIPRIHHHFKTKFEKEYTTTIPHMSIIGLSGNRPQTQGTSDVFSIIEQLKQKNNKLQQPKQNSETLKDIVTLIDENSNIHTETNIQKSFAKQANYDTFKQLFTEKGYVYQTQIAREADSEMMQAFNKLQQDAQKRFNLTLNIVSDFRTVEQQWIIFNRELSFDPRTLTTPFTENQKNEIRTRLSSVAAPGTSEHHTGRAIDYSIAQYPITTTLNRINWPHEIMTTHLTPQYFAKFGFVISYPNESQRKQYKFIPQAHDHINTKGAEPEPWHLKYFNPKGQNTGSQSPANTICYGAFTKKATSCPNPQ